MESSSAAKSRGQISVGVLVGIAKNLSTEFVNDPKQKLIRENIIRIIIFIISTKRMLSLVVCDENSGRAFQRCDKIKPYLGTPAISCSRFHVLWSTSW
jgi:hypothetical protein